MRRQPLQWAMIGGMVVLVVMFGIDLASNGVERIYGPVDQTGAASVGGNLTAANPPAYAAQNAALPERDVAITPQTVETERTEQPYAMERTVGEAQRDPEGVKAQRLAYERQLANEQTANERLPGLPDVHDDTTVDKLADGTAGMLQSLSNQGIRFVVSLFESVTD